MQTVSDRDTRIVEIICDQLEIEPSELGETDRFVEDHGADSLAMIGVLAALEKEFRISVEQSDVDGMVDLRSVRDVVVKTAGW